MRLGGLSHNIGRPKQSHNSLPWWHTPKLSRDLAVSWVAAIDWFASDLVQGRGSCLCRVFNSILSTYKESPPKSLHRYFRERANRLDEGLFDR